MRNPILLLLVLALLLIACAESQPNVVEVEVTRVVGRASDGADFDAAEEEAAAEAPAPFGESADRGERQQIERLVIKTASMDIEVEQIDEAVDTTAGLAIGLGGYVINQEVSGFDQFRRATVRIAVPAADFEQVVAQLRELGEVNSETISGEDVTEEFVDLNSRLENLEATQERLRELYDEARNVEETLEVDRELRRIEEELNVIQGRINYLSERAAFSTITASFSSEGEEPLPTVEQFNLSRTVERALLDLQDASQIFAQNFVYFGIVCGPWLLLIAVLLLIVRAVWKRVKRRSNRRTSTLSTIVTDPDEEA